LAALVEAVDIGPGLRVLRRIEDFEIADDDLDVTATATLVFDVEHGRYDAEQLAITRGPNAPPMREVLRRFRLVTLLDQFVMAAVTTWALVEVAPGQWQPRGTARLDDEDDEHYAARIYRLAAVAGYRPNKAVEEALGVAASTAAQKVWLARKLGLLPPTRPGEVRT
jgi:hypothetical protein